MIMISLIRICDKWSFNPEGNRKSDTDPDQYPNGQMRIAERGTGDNNIDHVK